MGDREDRDTQETEDYRAGRSYDGLLAKFKMLAMWTEECEQMLCEMGDTKWLPSARLADAYRVLAVAPTGFNAPARSTNERTEMSDPDSRDRDASDLETARAAAAANEKRANGWRAELREAVELLRRFWHASTCNCQDCRDKRTFLARHKGGPT